MVVADKRSKTCFKARKTGQGRKITDPREK